MKFSPHTSQCIFIVYPPNTKGYKVYELSTKRSFISQDVFFHKEIFPFATSDSHQPIISDDIFSNTSLWRTYHCTKTKNGEEEQLWQKRSYTIGITYSIFRASARHQPSKIYWNRKSPSYLQDFHYYLTIDSPQENKDQSTRHPISEHISYDNIPVNQKLLSLNISQLNPSFTIKPPNSRNGETIWIEL